MRCTIRRIFQNGILTSICIGPHRIRMICVKSSTVLSFQVNFLHVHSPALHSTKTIFQHPPFIKWTLWGTYLSSNYWKQIMNIRSSVIVYIHCRPAIGHASLYPGSSHTAAPCKVNKKDSRTALSTDWQPHLHQLSSNPMKRLTLDVKMQN